MGALPSSRLVILQVDRTFNENLSIQVLQKASKVVSDAVRFCHCHNLLFPYETLIFFSPLENSAITCFLHFLSSVHLAKVTHALPYVDTGQNGKCKKISVYVIQHKRVDATKQMWSLCFSIAWETLLWKDTSPSQLSSGEEVAWERKAAAFKHHLDVKLHHSWWERPSLPTTAALTLVPVTQDSSCNFFVSSLVYLKEGREEFWVISIAMSPFPYLEWQPHTKVSIVSCSLEGMMETSRIFYSNYKCNDLCRTKLSICL